MPPDPHDRHDDVALPRRSPSGTSAPTLPEVGASPSTGTAVVPPDLSAALTEALAAVRDGDLSVRLPTGSGNGTERVAVAFNEAVETIGDRLGHAEAEVDRLTRQLAGEREAGTQAADEQQRAAAEALEHAHRRLVERADDLERSNADLASFAYIASHDLSEPLRVVSGYVGLLRSRYADRLDEDAQKYIEFALSGTARMKSLIDDLLTYSRAGASGQVGPVDTAQVARHTLQVLDRTLTETGALVTAGMLPVVAGDEVQLGQVFQNLLGNAVKFRRPDVPVRVHVAAEPSADGWLFSVADNGIGIEPRHADRVFEMFQRLHPREAYGGTGIGLAICRRIIERAGGRIWVEPNAGGGSVFRFTLPDVTAVPEGPVEEHEA